MSWYLEKGERMRKGKGENITPKASSQRADSANQFPPPHRPTLSYSPSRSNHFQRARPMRTKPIAHCFGGDHLDPNAINAMFTFPTS